MLFGNSSKIERGQVIVAVLLAVVALVALDVVLYRRNGRSGVMAAFPCVAAAAGILAVGWVASIYR